MRLINSALREGAVPGEAAQVLRKFFDGMSSFMIDRVEPRSAAQSDASDFTTRQAIRSGFAGENN